MTPVRYLSFLVTFLVSLPAVCDAKGVPPAFPSARPSFLMTICPSSFVR